MQWKSTTVMKLLKYIWILKKRFFYVKYCKHIPCKYCSKIRDEPFRRIKANNTNSTVPLQAKLQKYIVSIYRQIFSQSTQSFQLQWSTRPVYTAVW